MDPQTPQGIENVLDTSRKLEETIKKLEEQRDAAKAELTELLTQYLAASPLSADSVIARYKAWNRRYEERKAELSIAKELQSIIEPLIKRLKKQQPESKEPRGRR